MSSLVTSRKPSDPGERQSLWLVVNNSVLALIRGQNLPQDARLPSPLCWGVELQGHRLVKSE